MLHSSFQTHRPTQSGFTLLEMVLSVVVIGIMAGILAPLFANVLSAGTSAASSVESMASVSMAMQRLQRELRQIDYDSASAAYLCDILSSTELRCYKNDAMPTQFHISYAAKSLNLAYSSPPASSRLLGNVSNFQLRFLDQYGNVTTLASALSQIEISISVDDDKYTDILSLRSRVVLRDKG